MATIQAFSPTGLVMNLADPLGINFTPDNDPISATATSVVVRTVDGGTLNIGGSGFGGFGTDSNSDLLGTVTDVARFNTDGSAQFSISGLNVALRTVGEITDSDQTSNYGLTLFSAIGTEADVVNGADGQADVLFSFNGNDTVRGFGGNDLIYGNKQDDQLFGGAGVDTLFGGQQRDVLAGEADADVLYGNFNEDTLFGGDGADTLFGGQSDDMINGEAGDDLIFANRGNDTMTGGAGNDTFQFGFQQQQGNNVINDFTVGQDQIVAEKTLSSSTSVG